MDFTLGDERQALVDSLGRLLRERHTVSRRTKAAQTDRGHDPEMWRYLSDIGAVGAMFAPEKGGFGGGAFDVTAVFETLGRSLVAEPVLPVLMAGTILSDWAPEEIEAIVAGSRIVAVGLYEPQSRYDPEEVRTRAIFHNGGWTIDGMKAVVQHAAAADALIISARDDDGALALFLVPSNAAGLTLRSYVTNDGTRAAEVRLDKVEVGSDARVGGIEALSKAIAIGTLALGAESLGIMEWLKDTTLEYLRTRVQFGTPIGSNQALQHRMVDLVVEIEQARSAVINAAAALGSSADNRDAALAAMKYTIGVSGIHVAEEAIQLHGGIGMTRELDLSHYAKRAMMIDHQLGDSDYHLARYVELIAA